jgi:RNA polymerase sigma-70 factor (ECF subfamily)
MKLPFPDNELVKKAQQGNRQAFDLLVLKYQHRILKIIRRYVADHHDSFDIIQESFMKAYLALPNFPGDSSFSTWLYQIAINTAKNYLAQTLKQAVTTTKKISASNLTENSLVGEETASCFAKSVNELSEELKTIFTLREWVGLSYQDIAQVTHCPIGTVRSRLFRAREIIAEKLKFVLENSINPSS